MELGLPGGKKEQLLYRLVKKLVDKNTASCLLCDAGHRLLVGIFTFKMSHVFTVHAQV